LKWNVSTCICTEGSWTSQAGFQPTGNVAEVLGAVYKVSLTGVLLFRVF